MNLGAPPPVTPQASTPPSQVTTTAALAAALGVALPKLNFWFYAMSVDARYTRFERKRHGDRPPRIIDAPIKPIKEIQRRVAALISGYYRRHYAVHGYVSGRSIVTNAQVHVRQRWVLRIDLTDFFPSINFGRVRGLFLSPPFSFSTAVATLLAHICCHRSRLPQGAPTSPLISNLICRRLDRQLGRLAASERCYYSRYCDDLVFSTNRRAFPPSLAITDPQTGSVVAGSSLRALISSNGFTINDTKTRLRSYSQRQIVTGLVTNSAVNIPRNFVRSVRNLLYTWNKYGETAAAASLDRDGPKNRPPLKPSPEFRLVVRGKVQYIGSIKGWDHPVYRALAQRLNAVDPSFYFRVRLELGPATTFRVFAEGKTDHTHLKSALEYFKSVGRFTDLQLVHDESTEGGGQQLFSTCKALASVPQPVPTIFVFDSDDPSLVSKVTDQSQPFKDWGNNVFSFVLPIPSHRERGAVCIEMLYADEVLQRRDADGRRLYLRSEFNPENGMHPVESVVCQNIITRTLVREEVFDRTTGAKMSLSKQAFASAISSRQPPFVNIPFDAFATVFDILVAIRIATTSSPGAPA